MYMFIYNLVLWAAFPFIRRRMEIRMQTGKEDRTRFSEREGPNGTPRCPMQTGWMGALCTCTSRLPPAQRVGPDRFTDIG